MQLNLSETKEALLQYAHNGSDLTKPMTIDFFIASDKQIDEQKINQEIKRESIETDKYTQEFDEESNSWTCYISITLIPNLNAVWSLEHKMERIARLCGARYDGFGSYGNAAS